MLSGHLSGFATKPAHKYELNLIFNPFVFQRLSPIARLGLLVKFLACTLVSAPREEG
jgi:hypothetical protein